MRKIEKAPKEETIRIVKKLMVDNKETLKLLSH